MATKSMILILVVLADLLPVVFCGVVPDISNKIYENLDISYNINEINYLNNLTTLHEKSGVPYLNQSELEITINNNDIWFNIFNRANTTYQKLTLSQITDITSLSSFNTSLETVFLIHGWKNVINSTVNYIISRTLLKTKDVNIIVVDWDGVCKKSYFTSFKNVPQVGKIVGKFIQSLSDIYEYSMDNVQLIGHSLGAHVSGYAGQETNGSIKLIVGLDPAGPLYSKSSPDHRLSKDDAQYVHVIHSNAGILGVTYDVGHADFWPNGGYSQPGCGVDITCDHGRSYYYFNESLSSTLFIAKSCNSYYSYTSSNCKNNDIGIMGGVYINTTIFGTYYLETYKSFPYAKGDIGI